MHRANIAHKECGWKDGDRGGLAEWELTLRKKKVKVCLTSTGLLMEGVSHVTAQGGCYSSWTKSCEELSRGDL